jgi:ribonuclease P protein component
MLKPLLGEQHFSMLMKSKPLSRTEAYFFHARFVPVLSGVAPALFLGLIVPKKVHALAVDRNRVRRVLRAQCTTALQALCDKPLLYDIHCLFRVKVLPKPVPRHGVKPQLNAAYLNPQSQQFSQLVQAMLMQALPRLLRECASDDAASP